MPLVDLLDRMMVDSIMNLGRLAFVIAVLMGALILFLIIYGMYLSIGFSGVAHGAYCILVGTSRC